MTQGQYGGNGFYQPSGGYLQQPMQQPMQQPTVQQMQAQYAQQAGLLPLEQSYIENILRLNKGKPATIYMTYERGSSLGTQAYKGIIEAAGRDHIIISDPTTGKRSLLLMIYLDYVEFEGEVNYFYPTQPSTYQSR
ncbi:spore coat protein GerQ [Ectobacillus ponti]|uniref:Spore coat protein GerQ n=1 Tax=Ectobacillus ponti TaxID=2961894 RepID=A0AA41X9R8_9BACI|nr:spore coat protein GerQ [Ectobacillus ponti]MCP8968011.1 spore coat protein GerQ [Ectobacillus ponti]